MWVRWVGIYRMHVAIVHQYLEHLARLTLKQAVIRKHDGGPAAGFQDSQNVLQEVQLFVRGFNSEVSAIRCLICSSGAEWRIR